MGEQLVQLLFYQDPSGVSTPVDPELSQSELGLMVYNPHRRFLEYYDSSNSLNMNDHCLNKIK